MFNSITINQSFVRLLGIEPAYLLFALLDRYKPEKGKFYEINFEEITDEIAMCWADASKSLEDLIEADLVDVKDTNIECVKEVTFITDDFDDIIRGF